MKGIIFCIWSLICRKSVHLHNVVLFLQNKNHCNSMDLPCKDSRILRKKSQLYLWNLLTIVAFCSPTAVQLVVTYQQVSDFYDSCHLNKFIALDLIVAGITEFQQCHHEGLPLIHWMFIWSFLWHQFVLIGLVDPAASICLLSSSARNLRPVRLNLKLSPYQM
jgi:hypothetical protein